jgi:nucleotide-binding universal stress UspA family protein
MAPLAGGPGDMGTIAAAAAVAAAFEANLAGVYAPADLTELAPWVGDGFVGGGAPVAALDTLREAAAEGERIARAAMAAEPYGRKTFTALESPIWAGLGLESRLSDLVVFNAKAAGRGPSALGDAFRQVLADEQRPVLIANRPPIMGGVVAVAWDAGKESTRATRTALPLLQKAREVVVLTAPEATPRHFDPGRIVDFLGQRGVNARLQTLAGTHDAAALLLEAARTAGADLLVAGAFGHPRLQEFIFGGVTRNLLNAADAPPLFLSH